MNIVGHGFTQPEFAFGDPFFYILFELLKNSDRLIIIGKHSFPYDRAKIPQWKFPHVPTTLLHKINGEH